MHFNATTSRRRWLIAAAALPLATAAGAQSEARLTPWPRSHHTPAVELTTADGARWTPASAHGHPVLLNFWATWCEPCRAEMPSLQQLAGQRQADGLRVLAANYKESEDKVRRFLEATGLQLPVLFDRDGAAAKAFGVHIFPSTVGIARNGQVKFVVTGEVDWTSAQAGRWVAQLL